MVIIVEIKRRRKALKRMHSGVVRMVVGHGGNGTVMVDAEKDILMG